MTAGRGTAPCVLNSSTEHAQQWPHPFQKVLGDPQPSSHCHVCLSEKCLVYTVNRRQAGGSHMLSLIASAYYGQGGGKGYAAPPFTAVQKWAAISCCQGSF